jgi:hypothetical protein
LLLDEYFRQIKALVDHCSIVQTSTVVYEVRSHDRGFLKGELLFVNGSILAIREFIKTTSIVDREMYTYQYMNSDSQLIFRYDNTGHHRKLNLPTFPHHKHDRSETHVIASDALELPEVLEEIKNIILD